MPSLNSSGVEFGFSFGFIRSQYIRTEPNRTGLFFGAGVARRLNNYFALHSGIRLSMLQYKYQGAIVETYTAQFPVHVIFRPIQRPIKPAFVGGINYKTRLGLFYEFGLRLEIQLPYFTLVPSWLFSVGAFSKNEELRLHYGLMNFDG